MFLEGSIHEYESSTYKSFEYSFIATTKSVVLCPTDTVRSALRRRFSFYHCDSSCSGSTVCADPGVNCDCQTAAKRETPGVSPSWSRCKRAN